MAGKYPFVGQKLRSVSLGLPSRWTPSGCTKKQPFFPLYRGQTFSPERLPASSEAAAGRARGSFHWPQAAAPGLSSLLAPPHLRGGDGAGRKGGRKALNLRAAWGRGGKDSAQPLITESMALNRQFMDFCLGYKIKRKINQI